MSLNLEKKAFVLRRGLSEIEQMLGSDGWYGLGLPGERLMWHFGRRWHQTQGDIAGIPAVISQCQGPAAWDTGRGTADMCWHGPFAFPRHLDFGGGDICGGCWELQKVVS